MLGDREPMTTIAVKDLARAKSFYQEKVGLKPLGSEQESVMVYRSGKSKVLLYQSQYAGTNKATAATWPVGEDIEKEIQSLKKKGITFEHYDMPGGTWQGDVLQGEGMKSAWFKDPDGNVIALVSGD
jgi:catechol-2,3-dioxygenase